MNDARPKIGLRKRILFSLLVTVVFFGLVELCFRGVELVNPPRHVDYGLGFNDGSRVFVPSVRRPGDMETQRTKRASFARQYFPQLKPEKTFRIVALGGSSVHFLEPDFKKLASELSKEFQSDLNQVEIINCGGHAYGSHRLVLVFREMLDYDPDLIVLYAGHNEFEEVEQLHLSDVDRLRFDRAISKSAFVRFLRDRKTDYDISRIEKEHNQRMLARDEPVSDTNYARAWSYDFTMHDVEERMQEYEHNLRLILTLAADQEIPVVMGTVATNLLRPYIPQTSAARYEKVYELWKQGDREAGLALARQILMETPGRHQASDLENGILRKLAQEFSLPLVDVEAMVIEHEPRGIPGESLFDDHCHLNAAGRAVWISGYAPRIREVIAERIE